MSQSHFNQIISEVGKNIQIVPLSTQESTMIKTHKILFQSMFCVVCVCVNDRENSLDHERARSQAEGDCGLPSVWTVAFL